MKKSRKILALVLSLALVFALAACTNNDTPSGGDTTSPPPSASTPVETPDASKTPENTPAASDYAVAMITDYGDITDQSFQPDHL